MDGSNIYIVCTFIFIQREMKQLCKKMWKIIKYLNCVVLGKSEMNYVDLGTVMTSWICERNIFSRIHLKQTKKKWKFNKSYADQYCNQKVILQEKLQENIREMILPNSHQVKRLTRRIIIKWFTILSFFRSILCLYAEHHV